MKKACQKLFIFELIISILVETMGEFSGMSKVKFLQSSCLKNLPIKIFMD